MKTITLILMACAATAMAQTNVVQPDKVETIVNTFANYLTMALAISTAFLAWWGRNKALIAKLVPTLIRSIESHGTPALKQQVSKEAGQLGIEPAMNAQVKALTPQTVDKPSVTVDALKQ